MFVTLNTFTAAEKHTIFLKFTFPLTSAHLSQKSSQFFSEDFWQLFDENPNGKMMIFGHFFQTRTRK